MMNVSKTYYSAPTLDLDTNIWSDTDFSSRKDVVTYVDAQFKYPSEYGLKFSNGFWNEQAVVFQETERKFGTGSYPVFMKNSMDFRRHWDFEKRKCAFEGFIIYKKPSEGIEFAVPGLFYWYLNYCPIPDKVKKRLSLPEIYDGDYHYFLYILRCILRRKYGVVLKKRQSGYTLKNMAILLNAIWFGNAAVSKIFAYDENKVKDSWGLMENYKDHINKYCGWTRGLDPSQKLNWQIRRKRKDGSYTGNMSIAKGFTTKHDPTNGVGGNATVIFGEESGINPTLDLTHEYITSNVGLGGLTTGLIIYSGAVGELDKADPLKEYIIRPLDYDFLACENKIEDDVEFGEVTGFFAPEWWNYVSVEEDDNGNQFGDVLRCYDEWGNTNKELALREVMKHRKKAETKKPELYRYYCSQRPLSIKEAFAFRKDSKFPLNLLEAQEQRINNKTYPYEYVDLERDLQGKVTFKKSNRLPITEFPLSSKTVDKEGVVVLHERPVPNAPFGSYYGTVDPVGEGKTLTSESLCSIYIYKADVEVTRIERGVKKTTIERGKIVASWCGRFDDINKTHERLEMLIELYNAWTIVENNISLFIQHMIFRKKQRFLVQQDQILFLKDLGSNANVFQTYGWKNTGTLFPVHLINYSVEFLKEVIHQETKENGDILKTTFGVERIPDIMLIKEMKAYFDGLNVDRLVAFSALVAFVRIQQSNRGYVKRVEEIDKEFSLPNTSLYGKPVSPFKHIGTGNSNNVNKKPPRNGFRHMK